MKKLLAILSVVLFANQASALEKNIYVLHLTAITPDVIQSVVVTSPKYHYSSQEECEQVLMTYLDRDGFRMEKHAGKLRILKGELPNLEFRQCDWVLVTIPD